MKKSIIITLLFIAICSICGCNNKNSSKESIESVNTDSLTDKADPVDALFEIAQYNAPVLCAEYTGEYEVEELKGYAEIKRYKYQYKLDSIIANKPEYNIPETFSLCVGEIHIEDYPQVNKGDKVLLVIRKGSQSSETGHSENEFTWNLHNNFYFVDKDNKIKNAFSLPEYSQYDGMSVDEFANEIGISQKAFELLKKDYDEGIIEEGRELKNIFKEYKEKINSNSK